jgi:cell division protein ZapA
MANVSIKFNNKEFLLSCEDGQEEHLEELAFQLSEKFNNLKSSLGNIGENKLLLITSITTMDEYYETKKKIDQKIEELKNLTEKFKELKSLVYEYKEKKENEINNLNVEQKKLKILLDKNNYEYEKVIEKATDEIENFLTKINSENPLQ